jgi:hypothetical protein
MTGWRSCTYAHVTGRDDVVRYRCADGCHAALSHRIVDTHRIPYKVDDSSRVLYSVLGFEKGNGEFESLAWTEERKARFRICVPVCVNGCIARSVTDLARGL